MAFFNFFRFFQGKFDEGKGDRRPKLNSARKYRSQLKQALKEGVVIRKQAETVT